MSSIPPAEEAAILQLIADSQTTNCLAAAALTLLVIEHIATFREEVKYVWQSRLSLWSVLYVWIRYFSLIAIAVDLSFMFAPMKSSKACQNYLFAEMVTSTVVSMSVDGILVLRVWLLYGKLRSFLYILVPLLIAEMGTILLFGFLTIIPLRAFADIGPLLNGCYSLTVPRLFTYYALPCFLMSILMFLMTAYKCAQHIRRASGYSHMPVITLFLRDGIFLFLAIMMYAVAEIIIWAKARASLAEIPVIPATAIPAVVGARILLNIKSLASEVNDPVPATELTTLTHIRPSPPTNVAIPWYLRTGEAKGWSEDM